ncbi:MAG: NAD-binding protein, partial [Terrimicrobiaceae bacterium]|nr:NAD-binding protein [Terrimicrobiaceae bacterium]
IIAAMGYGRRNAFLAGAAVAQISEFSFIFVAVGVSSGLVGGRVAAITAMVGIITIAASAYLILYNNQLFEMVARWMGWRDSAGPEPENGRSGHVIVVGMNSLGRRLARELVRRGCQVLAIDTDSRKLRGLPCEGLVGSTEYLDVLLDAGLPRAALLVSALRIEEANELLAYRCRQFGVPCSIHAVDLSVVDNLLELGAAYLMLSKVDGVKLQNRHLREAGYLPT